MHRLRHVRGAQIAVNFIGHKRNERRGHPAEVEQHMMQRAIGFQFVGVVAAFPEAAAAPANVPVGEVVNKFAEPVRRLLKVVVVQRLGDLAGHLRQRTQYPAVQRIRRIFRSGGTGSRLEIVDTRIRHKETVGVPQRDHHAANDLADTGFGKLKVLGSNHLTAKHKQSQSIGAAVVHHLHRVGIVAQPLGHFLPVFSQHQPVDHHMFERRFVEQRRRQHHQSIEPAAGLIQTFGNEVGRKHRLEMRLVLKRIMILRIRHRTGLEPAVQHLRNALQRRLPGRRRNFQFVHKMLVQIGDLFPGQLLQLGDRSDAHRLALVIPPDRQRRTPIAVARDRPVAGVGQPFAETPLFEVRRHPFNLFIRGNHLVLDRLDLDKPGGNRAVDQRVIVAPAMRITVFDGGAEHQFALGLKPGDHLVVHILDKAPLIIRHLGGETAKLVDRTDFRQTVFFADRVVVLAEPRSDMHDAGTVLGTDEVRQQNLERLLRGEVGKIVKQRLVAHAFQSRTFELGHNLRRHLIIGAHP